ncbi:MAG: hypothetical protein A4E35_02031 [Methanoregula sp. PtaU1.Bin051]|nr:MAG: hypothetical protein A4E35_02031 [Methanoregula sp. PtaU1.Bin051]
MPIGRLAQICILFLIFSVVSAAGCLGVKTPPVSHPPAPAVFVDYHRSGGPADTDDRLVIFDNGAAVVATKTVSTEIVMNATDIEGITSLFDHAQFPQLQANYPARRGSADLYHYSISYRGKTVTLDESAYPPSLQPLIDGLDQVIRSSR